MTDSVAHSTGTSDVLGASKLYLQSAAYNTVNVMNETELASSNERADNVFAEINEQREAISEDVSSLNQNIATTIFTSNTDIVGKAVGKYDKSLDEQFNTLVQYGSINSKLDSIEEKQDEILDDAVKDYEKKQEAYGSFDFMEGLSTDDVDDYFNQLSKLSFGQLLESDNDSDAAISYEEYEAQNKEEFEGHIDDSLIQEFIANGGSKEEFDAIDYNGDGKLDRQELMTLYWLADLYGQNADGEFFKEDGKYSFTDMQDLILDMQSAKKADSSDATEYDKENKEFFSQYYKFTEELF